MSGKAVSSVLLSVIRISSVNRPLVGRVANSVALRLRNCRFWKDENAPELMSLMGLRERSLHGSAKYFRYKLQADCHSFDSFGHLTLCKILKYKLTN